LQFNFVERKLYNWDKDEIKKSFSFDQIKSIDENPSTNNAFDFVVKFKSSLTQRPYVHVSACLAALCLLMLVAAVLLTQVPLPMLLRCRQASTDRFAIGHISRYAIR